MAANVKGLTKKAIDELCEGEAAEVLNFICYLRWRRENIDQSWFWTEEWQKRYEEAMADLAEGRFRDFDEVEDLLTDLNSQPASREELFDGETVETLYDKIQAYQRERSESEKKA